MWGQKTWDSRFTDDPFFPPRFPCKLVNHQSRPVPFLAPPSLATTKAAQFMGPQQRIVAAISGTGTRLWLCLKSLTRTSVTWTTLRGPASAPLANRWETMCLSGICRGIAIPRFLGRCEMDFAHPQYGPFATTDQTSWWLPAIPLAF